MKWPTPYKDAKREFEREYCRELLERADGNIALAARLAMMDRRSFYEMLYRTGERQPRSEVPAA